MPIPMGRTNACIAKVKGRRVHADRFIGYRYTLEERVHVVILESNIQLNND